jgi:hypothetical protein
VDSKPTTSQNELLYLEQLREILLKEDREAVLALQKTINEREKLSEKVVPIIEEQMDFLKKNFPREFALVVDDMIDKRIKSSQTELLDTMYPVLGQMIKKYITHQIEQLKESIEKTIRAALDTKNIWWKIKASIFGIKQNELLLDALEKPRIEEVTLIQMQSGLILGNASLNPTIDKDIIAGMLTAIKAFVEDAFQRENERLDMIQYDNYKILLFNYFSYYAAVALSGPISSQEKEDIEDILNDFIINELQKIDLQEVDKNRDYISARLDDHFIKSHKNFALK